LIVANSVNVLAGGAGKSATSASMGVWRSDDFRGNFVLEILSHLRYRTTKIGLPVDKPQRFAGVLIEAALAFAASAVERGVGS
jgi:hypothetical protein